MDSRQKLKDSILEATEAATRIESYPINHNKSATVGLPTPESTPGPDDEKVIEELKRTAAAKTEGVKSAFKTLQQEELNRIINCSNDAYDDILGVKQDVKEEDKGRIRAENCVLIGCLLNPGACELDKSKEAREKLYSAAEKVEIDNVYIELANNWDVNTMIPMNKVATGIKIQEEIKRILACANDEYDDILGVDPSIKEDDKRETRENNWIIKGCELHRKYCRFKQTDKAFLKLEKAAHKMEVDDAMISAVKQWDGREDLLNYSEEEEDEEDDDEFQRQSEMECEDPNPKTLEVYRKATRYMKMLIADPSNGRAAKAVEQLNGEIDENPKIYHIEYKNFRHHYKIVLKAYETLFKYSGEEYPEDNVPTDKLPQPSDKEQSEVKLERAKRDIPRARGLINIVITKRHYLTDWSIPDAEYYRNLLRPGTESSQNQRPGTESSQNQRPGTESSQNQRPGTESSQNERSETEFPNYGEDWFTLPYNDTSQIIGWRKIGKIGKQVCIERKENGLWIRRIAAASKCGAGLDIVDKYCETPNSKDLAKDQHTWARKNGADFVKLHWVTQSVTISSSRDPTTYCCVEFRNKGKKILTASNFRRVVSADKANIEITNVCKRDGINVPWKRGCLTDIGYPHTRIKDPDERFAAVDKVSRNQDKKFEQILLDKTSSGEDRTALSSSANELSSIIERVTMLESTIKSMNTILLELPVAIGELTRIINVQTANTAQIWKEINSGKDKATTLTSMNKDVAAP